MPPMPPQEQGQRKPPRPAIEGVAYTTSLVQLLQPELLSVSQI